MADSASVRFSPRLGCFERFRSRRAAGRRRSARLPRGEGAKMQWSEDETAAAVVGRPRGKVD
jgi:hypothetical protein